MEYKPLGLSRDACNATPLISEPALRARRGYPHEGLPFTCSSSLEAGPYDSIFAGKTKVLRSRKAVGQPFGCPTFVFPCMLSTTYCLLIYYVLFYPFRCN